MVDGHGSESAVILTESKHGRLKMNCRLLALLALSAFLIPQLPAAWAAAGPEIAIGPMIGTSGLGVEASIPIISQSINLNAGISGFGFNITENVDDGAPGTTYNARVRLGAVPIYLSYYPGRSWFNLQAGMFFNANRISYTSDYIENGRNYGVVSGSSNFNVAAPFIGVGFGQPFAGSRITFTGNLGVAFAGGPGITLQPSTSITSQLPDAAAQIQSYQNELNNKASWAEFFPVLSFGMAYRF